MGQQVSCNPSLEEETAVHIDVASTASTTVDAGEVQVEVVTEAVSTGKFPVTLHIYEVADRGLQLVNVLVRPTGTGAFHTGVEVHGKEWSFGSKSDRGTGIFSCRPRKSPIHHYKEAVQLGTTDLSKLEVLALVRQFEPEWQGQDYDLFFRNCCSFCIAFASALGANALPPWVTSLARNGAVIWSGVKAVESVTNCSVQKVQHVLRSINIVLECILAEGTEIGNLCKTRRCIPLRLVPGEQCQVGLRQQSDIFSYVAPDNSKVRKAFEDVDQLFTLVWEPPCLYAQKPRPDVALYINESRVRQTTCILLHGSVISLAGPEEGRAILKFKVSRQSDPFAQVLDTGNCTCNWVTCG